MRVTLFGVAVLATSSVTASRLLRSRQVPAAALPVALPVAAPATIPTGVVPRDILPGGKSPLDSELVQYKTWHSRATEDRISFITPEGEHPIIHNFHGREGTEGEADNDKSHNDAPSDADSEHGIKEPCLESRAPIPVEEQALAAKTNGLGLATHHFDNTGASNLAGDLQPRGTKPSSNERHPTPPTPKLMARNDIPLHATLGLRPTGVPQSSSNGDKSSHPQARSTIAKMVKVGSDDTGLHYENYKEGV